MKKLFLLVVLFCAPGLYAQNIIHVFPHVVDGVFGDGSYYKSTFAILPWLDARPTCNLELYGLSITLDSSHSSNHTITLQPGVFSKLSSAANQAFGSGYATLTCSSPVLPLIIYQFYAPDGSQLSEAIVESSRGNFGLTMMVDQREGARLGVAIANNTDTPHTYRLTIGAATATVDVPARASLARFLDEIVSGVPDLGIVAIDAVDRSRFDAIGLRLIGTNITPIPANQ